MDATVQLAALEKLRAIFVEDGLGLACPLMPPIYSPQQLEAIGRGGANAQELAWESAWIRAVNAVPTSSSWVAAEPQHLWDALDQMKQRPVVFGTGHTSAVNEAELSSAEALLFEDPDAEPRQYSDVYLAYLQHQDLYLAAVQLYRQRRDEALASSDPEVAEFWHATAAAGYQAEIDKAQFNWVSLGHKVEIEAAQRVLSAEAERQPQVQWQRWMNRYNAAVDARSDLSLLKFVPTSFSPANVSGMTDWPEAVIEADQIARLVAGAPQDMQRRLGQGRTDTLRVSFEYARLTIERAWFPSRAFEARFWRFEDNLPALSDGALPPNGAFPGYIVGALLVRKLMVHTRRGAPSPPASPPPVWVPPPVVSGGTVRDHRRSGTGPLVRDHRRMVLTAAPPIPPVAMPLQPAALQALQASRTNLPSRSLRDMGQVASLHALDRDMQLRTQAFRKRSVPFTADTVTADNVLGDSEMAVLAYLWKRFPRTPDPDPGLEWPTTT